jgi:glycosyltransferase involved in cell wall biosynthesis
MNRMSNARRNRVDCSIILPCLNEAGTVGACIRQTRKALARLRVKGEVIVADNGSMDGSDRLAVSAGARVIRISRKGYGAAIRGGVDRSGGRWIIVADADGTYGFNKLPEFLHALQNGYDLVQGSRLKGNLAPGAMPWSHRYIGTPLFNLLLRLFYGMRVTDSQSGMRAFSRHAYDRMCLKSIGMEINTEILIRASRLDLKYKEVAIGYGPALPGRRSHLRALVDGWRNLKLILLGTRPGR